MAKRRNFINRLPLAPVFALLFGTAVAIVISAAPQWRFEQAIDATGLSSLLSVARPPLGLKARLLAISLGFAVVAIIVWLATMAVERSIDRPIPRDDDAHDTNGALDQTSLADGLAPIDAPRRPIFADRELGAPFMSDEALVRGAQPIAEAPVDEPHQPRVDALVDIEEVAFENDDEHEFAGAGDVVSSGADAALAVPLELAEFDIVLAPDEPEQLPGETSIEGLIRRLEAGLARRAGPPPPPVAAANPVGVMRDLLAIDRGREVHDDAGSARALDTLEHMRARRLAR